MQAGPENPQCPRVWILSNLSKKTSAKSKVVFATAHRPPSEPGPQATGITPTGLRAADTRRGAVVTGFTTHPQHPLFLFCPWLQRGHPETLTGPSSSAQHPLIRRFAGKKQCRGREGFKHQTEPEPLTFPGREDEELLKAPSTRKVNYASSWAKRTHDGLPGDKSGSC